MIEITLDSGNKTMPDLSTPIMFIALAAVALVLILGLFNMMRGGSANKSQKLMRLRVLLQFAAIIIVMGLLYFKAG